jgi:protein-S-isoprenylcysteine O-methyltransferase Ste14
MRTVIIVLGMLLLISCSVLILAGWRNPANRFLVGFVQTRNVKSGDPARRAAAACWLILGFAAGSVGLLASVDPDQPLGDASLHNILGYVGALGFVACLAIAVWVRWGDAPQSLRPAAMRDPA